MRRELLIEKFNPSRIDEKNNAYWYNRRGELHRDRDQPAIITADGEMR